jgi:nucleotide-binding universal stress UspA family protein
MSEILVGVDGTPRGEDALAFAGRLAAGSGASLRLVLAYPYEEWPSRAASHEYGAYLRREATAQLERLAASSGLTDVPRQVVSDPSPARALQHVADQRQASLIVVGSTGRGVVGRVLPGSTAERLLHGAPCPVAIVPHGYRSQQDAPVRLVGVGYDGSDGSESALAAATAVARRLGAGLRVIGVFDDSQVGAPMVGAFGYGGLRQEAEELQRSHLEERVADLPGDVHAESAFLVGAPGPRLADQTHDLDLMVVGSRGYGPLRAVLLGGVSHVLVREAACPVVVLPRGVHGGVETLFGATAQAMR